MSKSSTASQSAKIPAALPTKSAWAKGPPPNTASSSSSRSQSPAPSLPQTSAAGSQSSHSRRPSTLSGQAVPIKDGVSIPRAVSNVSRPGNSPVTFGSIDDTAAPLSSSPAATPTPAVKGDGVKTFGSIAAGAHSHSSSVQRNGKPPVKPTTSATPPPTSTNASQTLSAKPASAATRPKFDVKAMFRGPAATPSAASSSTVSTPASTSSQQLTPSGSSETSASPSVRPSALPPHGHAPNNFTRNPSQNGSSGPPRSPVFPRGQAQKPPGNGPPMSPSMGTRPMPPPTSGLPSSGPPPPQPYIPGMPPPQQGYMYYPNAGMPDQTQYMQQYYNAGSWYMPQMPHPGAPGSPMTGMSQPLASPPQQPPLQQQPTPGTPKLAPTATPPVSGHTPSASITSPPLTPSNNPRLNTSAATFVPGGGAGRTPSKVVMKRPDGGDIDLTSYIHKTSQPASPAKPPVQLSSPRRPPSVSIRLESPEDRDKRLAEEKEKEEKEKKAKEDAAKKVEEEAQKKVEAEKKAQEEKERKEKEEKQKIEDDRKRKEAEEAAKLEAEKAEKEKAAEEERLRQKLEEEEKERKAKADKEAADAAAAAAKSATPEPTLKPVAKEEKEEGEISSTESDKDKAAGAGAPNSKAFPTSAPSELRRRPGPLDLSSTQKPMAPSLPSAISTARIIVDLESVSYPEGIKSPQVELNVNAKDSKFRYDRDFLLQFMQICKEKPDSLPPLEAIGLEPQDPASYQMTRGGSGRHRQGSSASIPSRQASLSNFAAGSSGFGGKGGAFSMGQFTTPAKLSSEDRFSMSNGQRSVSTSSGFGGRPPPMVRTASQGGHASTRTRSKRGTQRPGNEKMGGQQGGQHHGGSGFNNQQPMDLGPVAPLQATENRWDRKTLSNIDPNSQELVERKVKSLLNKLTMEKFDKISDQVIEWANKSEDEKDGRTLIQVIKLVFEKATDEATWSEMYARLCRKMMEQLSTKVQDDGIKNTEGKPITGGQLFRKYLLNRCQEDFERGWINKESTAAAAKSKAAEDGAAKGESKEGDEVELYSEEYYAAQKAKRQGLGLIKFIGELFKLQMLTERIMHECVKKLLGNVDNPEEEEIESLCKLLATVGSSLDTTKARAHMDVYFQRMKELTKSPHVNSRMQFMLQDVIEMRERRWVSRNAVAAPSTIAEVREKAEKEKAAQEKESYQRTQSMSRGGSRRGGPRGGGGDDGGQVGPDGWSNVAPRAPPKAGDLSKFGQISKGSSGGMVFGPSSVFLKDKKGPVNAENKRESLSRSNSTNMFAMLNMGAEQAPEAAAAGGEPPARRKLVLQPRSKPVEGEEDAPSASTPVEGESEAPVAELSDADAKKAIEEDLKEFFAVRDLGEAETYFTKLPSKFHSKLVDKLASHAIESKAADAQLVADFFALGAKKNLVSSASFEEGFSGLLEFLDDIVVDAPKAVELMATMMKGPEFSDDVKSSLCAKSADSGEKLRGLL